MPIDGDTDYRRYTRVELEEALGNIDASHYPTNLANLRKELEARTNGTSGEPLRADNSRTDATIGYWVEVGIAGMVTLYTFIGALTGNLVIPVLSMRRQVHLTGVAAWMAMAAVLTGLVAVCFGGLDTSDPPKIRPKLRWVFRLAGAALVVALCWQQFHAAPN